jgi:hypothetical protein
MEISEFSRNFEVFITNLLDELVIVRRWAMTIPNPERTSGHWAKTLNATALFFNVQIGYAVVETKVVAAAAIAAVAAREFAAALVGRRWDDAAELLMAAIATLIVSLIENSPPAAP